MHDEIDQYINKQILIKNIHTHTQRNTEEEGKKEFYIKNRREEGEAREWGITDLSSI